MKLKSLLKTIFGLFNIAWLKINGERGPNWDSKIFLTSLRLNKNKCTIQSSTLIRCKFFATGTNNFIDIEEAYLSHSSLFIEGTNNTIRIGKNSSISDLRIIVKGNNCHISIGDLSTFNGGRMVCSGENNGIFIGRDCMISDCVEIWSSDTHPIFDADGNIVNPSRPITIGDSVWIGTHAFICKGTSIAHNAIVGMNSVVTTDIPNNTVSAGNPNRVLKQNIQWNRKLKDNLFF